MDDFTKNLLGEGEPVATFEDLASNPIPHLFMARRTVHRPMDHDVRVKTDYHDSGG